MVVLTENNHQGRLQNLARLLFKSAGKIQTPSIKDERRADPEQTLPERKRSEYSSEKK